MILSFLKDIRISRFFAAVPVTVAVLIPYSYGKNDNDGVFDAILDLYKEYDMVHIADRHWNMTDYNFRLGLLHYPLFVEIVNDIVIESGNYLYQDVLDRYILELEDVPKADLQKVWRNTAVVSGSMWS